MGISYNYDNEERSNLNGLGLDQVLMAPELAEICAVREHVHTMGWVLQFLYANTLGDYVVRVKMPATGHPYHKYDVTYDVRLWVNHKLMVTEVSREFVKDAV